MTVHQQTKKATLVGLLLMLVLSLTNYLKRTNSSALEVFNPLFLDFLGTATMSGLRLRLELMSLTKRRTEYYLIKRKSISLLRVKTSSLVAFFFSDWIKKTNRLLQSASVCVDRLYRQIFVSSQYNPPDRHISFFSKYVSLTDQNSS